MWQTTASLRKRFFLPKNLYIILKLEAADKTGQMARTLEAKPAVAAVEGVPVAAKNPSSTASPRAWLHRATAGQGGADSKPAAEVEGEAVPAATGLMQQVPEADLEAMAV